MASIYTHCKSILDLYEIQAFQLENIDSEKCSSRVLLRITENTIHYFKAHFLPITFSRLYDNNIISQIENKYEDNKKLWVEFCMDNNVFNKIVSYLKSIHLTKEESWVVEELIYNFASLLESLHIKKSDVYNIVNNQYIYDRYFTLGNLLNTGKSDTIVELMEYILSLENCRDNADTIKSLFNIHLLYKAYSTELIQYNTICSQIYNLKDQNILAYQDIVFAPKAWIILIWERLIEDINKSNYNETIKDILWIADSYDYNAFRNSLWLLYQSIINTKREWRVMKFRKVEKDELIWTEFYTQFKIEYWARYGRYEYFERKYYNLLRAILKNSKSIYSDD